MSRGMGYKHKLNNQHIHFHSLLHTLAGLNENQHPRLQFQELLYLIWFWRSSHHRKNYGKSTKHPQNDLLTDTQPGEEAHRSLQYHHGSEISKVVMCFIPAWFPSIATLTLMACFATKSDCRIFEGRRRFATVVHTNSTRLPRHRLELSSERYFKPSNVGYLPFNQRRHYFSLRL